MHILCFQLKDALIPLLKGQPHLEQELTMLFPDHRPPDSYMMDFEEVNLADSSHLPVSLCLKGSETHLPT